MNFIVPVSSFTGSNISDELSSCFYLLPKLDSNLKMMEGFFKLCFQVLTMKNHTIDGTSIERTSLEFGITNDECKLLLSGLTTVILKAVKSRQSASVISKDLLQISVPPNVVEYIKRLIDKFQHKLEKHNMAHRIHGPSLSKLKWRVDVTLHTNAMSRVLAPSVIVSFFLSDGRIKTFEISIEKFDKLRYSVATVLKDMRQLEIHPIMSVVKAEINRDRRTTRTS